MTPVRVLTIETILIKCDLYILTLIDVTAASKNMNCDLIPGSICKPSPPTFWVSQR